MHTCFSKVQDTFVFFLAHTGNVILTWHYHYSHNSIPASNLSPSNLT